MIHQVLVAFFEKLSSSYPQLFSVLTIIDIRSDFAPECMQLERQSLTLNTRWRALFRIYSLQLRRFHDFVHFRFKFCFVATRKTRKQRFVGTALMRVRTNETNILDNFNCMAFFLSRNKNENFIIQIKILRVLRALVWRPFFHTIPEQSFERSFLINKILFGSWSFSPKTTN